jgi:hypothetical protein
MTDQARRVTLSKAHQSVPAGQELIALLTTLSADGQVTREEVTQLRAWLEVDRGVDFPACAFLYELIDTISADGNISEEELDTLALGIERVLPADVRAEAAAKRKAHLATRRVAVRAQRQEAREQERNLRLQERERSRPLHRGDFVVMGARRSEERREGCAALIVGESITLEREPDNRHDANAILVFGPDGSELGYVPRDDARDMAPLIDASAQIEASVKKLIETEDGDVIPVVISVLRRAEHDATVEGASLLESSRTDDVGAVHEQPVVAPRNSRWALVACVVGSVALVAAYCG